MTPTLMGRWQTRLLFLATVGVLVSIPFWLIAGTPVFFVILAWVAILGLAWDVAYSFLQAFRWERDWPPAFALIAGIIEGVVIYELATNVGLPGIPRDLALDLFVFQYSVVWLVTFFWGQGPMRVLTPWWRYHGGRIWPGVSSDQRR